MTLRTGSEAQIGEPVLSGVVQGRDVVRQDTQASTRRGPFGIGLVVLATTAWSSGGVFINIVVAGSSITPLGLAFWRVFCTFMILLLGIALIRPALLRVARRDLVWLAGLGALAMGTFQALWVASVLTNGLSVASVIQCNAPIIVTLLAWLFWRESLTWQKWAALTLAGVGTVLIAQPTSAGNVQITGMGLMIALGSALAYSAITLFTKKLTGDYNQWTILVYGFGFAALALLPFQFGRPLPVVVSGQAWLAFAALLLITTISGYGLYASALKHLPASVASIVAMSEVPLSAIWGYLLLHERLDAGQIIGAIVVISGMALLSLRVRTRA
jgi:drug/metabolite transporter (DMT)-like permease